MKIIKALIPVDQSSGATHYTYPQVWLDNKERIPSILYPQDRTDQVDINGIHHQVLYPVVPDDLAVTLLALPNFSTPTRAEVSAYADKHAPVKEVITDQTAVLTALAQVVQGKPLTKKQTDAIDPQHPEPGITKCQPWLQAMEAEHSTLI